MVIFFHCKKGIKQMLQYDRFETILNKLQTQSSVRVTELSKELGASESTIRRDIADLAKAGKLQKVFGGAVPLPNGTNGTNGANGANGTDRADETGTSPAARRTNTRSRDLQEKENIQAEEKSEVAAYAATLIEDGDLIYIDAGTTTGRMIDHITCTGATFVTNGARHAIRLAARGLKTYLLSGRMKAATEAIIGPDAVASLQKYHFTKCFIGTDGADEECGLTTADIEESMVKTEAIRRSGSVYVLADSSKFGLVAPVTFAPLDAGTIITDRLPAEDYRTKADIIELR